MIRHMTLESQRRVDFEYRVNKPIKSIFHSHTCYEVYYFHEGRCNYLIGNQIYSLAPGDLILMNGMTLHCAKVDPEYPYIRSIAHFEPAVFRPYLELPLAVNFLKPFEELKDYRLCLRGEAKEEAERILAVMSRYKEQSGEVGRRRLELAFVDLLHFIYEQCEEPMQEVREYPSEKEKTVQNLISLLEQTYTDDLHMEDLCRQLHVSKAYLAKIFKEVTGVTIFEYMYRKRINEARYVFLTEPDVSVTEVCFRLGFKHLAHFSRLFKQQVGTSPEKYKLQAR